MNKENEILYRAKFPGKITFIIPSVYNLNNGFVSMDPRDRDRIFTLHDNILRYPV